MYDRIERAYSNIVHHAAFPLPAHPNVCIACNINITMPSQPMPSQRVHLLVSTLHGRFNQSVVMQL
eukprot:scaffold23733_cov37-Tisochrysis_lutea.AAC.1